MSVRKVLLCPQKDFVQAVIAQSRSHLPLRVVQSLHQRLSLTYFFIVMSGRPFRPHIPPKLKDIAELVSGGPRGASNFKPTSR